MCLLPGLSFGENPRIAELTRSKQEKMERLQKCEGTTKALKIAGLSTIGLTAVGVVGNVVEAQKLQTYQGQSNALDTQIAQTKKEIEDKKVEIEKKKAAAAAAPGPSATPPAETTPTEEKSENTLGDTVCNIKCDESYKDKTIVCKTDNKYASYKCSDNKWTKDNVQTCNDRMIADSTYTKIEQYDGTANTYLFSLPGKNKISNKEAYLGTDVCYACERWNEGTWVYKDGKCTKAGYAKTCDTDKKIGDDCTADKPHATAAQCKSIGAKSNGKDILTCVATACDTANSWTLSSGNCVKQATNASDETTTGSSGIRATSKDLQVMKKNVETQGNSWVSWDFNDVCLGAEKNASGTHCGNLSQKGHWKVNFSYAVIYGEASCNSIAATYAWSENGDELIYTLQNDDKKAASVMSSTSNGLYCWCRTTKIERNGSRKALSSSSWVFYLDYESAGDCADSCASSCAYWVKYGSSFRGAVFAGAGN